MEVSGDNWSYERCKVTVKSSSPTNQHPMFCRPDALPAVQPTVSVSALKGKTFSWMIKSYIYNTRHMVVLTIRSTSS